MMANSPFTFRDTASSRQATLDLAERLVDERVAIVGVGGTGSFVLDFVSKTWVREIHLFDNDEFMQHNAFRAPGPFSIDDLRGLTATKAEFHGARYAKMHRGISAFSKHIDQTNVGQLGSYDTVFLCIDGGPVKQAVLSTCMAEGVLMIDCGMGVMRSSEGGSLIATIRTTTCTPDHHFHARRCIDLAGVDAPGEYEWNAQMAELNALNAALAVIKWKKIRGIYRDFARELDCAYVLDGNRLINRFEVKENVDED